MGRLLRSFALFCLVLATVAGIALGCRGTDCHDGAGDCVKETDGGVGGDGDPGLTDGGGEAGADAGTAKLALNRPAFEFGVVATGSKSGAATFTVTNTGDGASEAISTALDGVSAALFKLDASGCAGKALSPGASCPLLVTFAPSAAGAAMATLTASAGESTATTALSGTGGASGALTVAPSGQAFGVVVAGSRSADQSFVATNTGTTATGALAVAVSGTDAAEFQVSADGCTGKTLAAGATCDLAARFAPKVAGSRMASLAITASPGGAASTWLGGAGIAGSPLTITPTTFDFGSTLEGTGTSGVTQDFTVVNSGLTATDRLAMTLAGGAAGEYKITVDGCGGKVLEAGETCAFTVRFEPASSGMKIASVSVADTSAAVAASLSGTGLGAAKLTAAPSPLSFGTVITNVDATATVTVKNTGGQATGSVVTALGGANAADFSIPAVSDKCAGKAIAPGASCTIGLTLKASATGARSGTLTVSASPGGGVVVNLSGTAVAPGALQVSPTSYDFGSVEQGLLSGTHTFLITNTGGVASGVPAVALSGSGASEFKITGDGCTAAVAPGGTCNVDVQFAPTTSGSPSASLTMTANPGGTAISALTGTALASPALGLSPLSVSYPDTVVGSTSSRTLTVSNTGDVSTGSVSANIGGTNAAEFSILPGGTCVGPLPGRSTCQITVEFKPQTVASNKSATLTVSATPGGTQIAALGGNGLKDATLTVDSPVGGTHDFGDLEVGAQSSTKTFVIRNTGDVVTGAMSTTLSSGELAATSSTCTGSLAKGATCRVAVRFTPSTYGARNATVTVSAAPGGSAVGTATAVGKWRLTVTRAGGGAATPISTSDGTINDCAAVTCTALFANSTTSMKVEARNANGSGYHFSSWSGACSGSFRDCSLTMIQSRDVTATYTTTNYNLAFLSSATYPSTLGSARAYDVKCNELANGAGINNAAGNAFVAWISDADGTAPHTLAISRLTPGTGSFVRLDDKPFALSKPLLTSKNILYPLNVDEAGAFVPGDVTTWTATADGGGARTGGACASWTSTAGNVDVGRASTGPGLWTVGYSASCSASRRIYCLQKEKSTLADQPTVPKGAKIAYYTVPTWPSSGGLAAADAFCNANKPAPYNTSSFTYGALLSTGTAAASSRVATGASYYRPDGVFIATGATIAAGGQLTSGFWYRSDGTYQGGEVRAWTGSTAITSTGTDAQHCTSWAASDTGVQGRVNATTSSYWYSFQSVACGDASLFCIQQ